MAGNVFAQALADALLEEAGSSVSIKRCLNEGTVIILNGDEAQNTAALNNIINLGGSDKAEPAKTDVKTQPAIKDRFDIKRDGKHWHFTVHRNDDGQISGVEVEES